MIDKDELISLVPHKGRMFLINRIISYDLENYFVEGECDISKDCLFFDPAAGGVPVWVSVELSAQIIAALFGLKRREMGLEPRLGFLLSISNMTAALGFFNTGSTVVLKANQINCIDMTYTFECSAFLNGKNVFETRITAVDVDDEAMKIFQKR